MTQWMPAIKSIEKRHKNNYQRVNVLVVDDHVENLIAIEAILASPHYRIRSVTSGAEALKQIMQQDYALILMDVQMPDLDGFEVARLIKSRQKTRHIPIVFITAINQAAEHVEKGFSVGAIDYIFKPFNPQTLRWKVEALVNYQAYYDQMKTQSLLLQEKTRALEEAYQQLHFINTNLENLVEVRTRELQASNLQLQQEIAEHKITKDHFRKMFTLSPNLISIRSLNDGRILDVNQSWLEHSGYSLEDLLIIGQQPFYSIDEPGFSEQIVIELEEKVHNLQVSYKTKSGETRYGLLSTELMSTLGEKQILSVVTDVTEILKLQKEMTRLDRLNLVGEMAASIGHEIRNPMTAVRGFLQLLANEDNSLNREYYSLMISELDRANGIISGFLDLAGNKTVELQWICLNDIINSLYPLIRADALRSDKNICLELEEIEPLMLDDKEIRQLIMNLCRNGLEAMSSGGTLSIKTCQYSNKIVLEVQDQGKGIDQDVLEKLGTPFLTTKPDGTGLGLPVCFSIAHRHQASIDINSDQNGTRVSVIFPLTKPKRSELSEMVSENRSDYQGI